MYYFIITTNLDSFIGFLNTVMCLSIGTPKIIDFPFVPNGKYIIFRFLKI